MFGTFIVERRKSLGMSDREQLRDALRDAGRRISNTSIRNWELGMVAPKGKHIDVLLKVLKVPECEWGKMYRLAYSAART